LDRVPLFARADALLPTMEPVERLTDAPWDPVVFDAYLLERGRTTLRDTDGKTDVSAALEESTLRVELSGAKRRVGLRVFPLAQRTAGPAERGGAWVESVLLNGEPLNRAQSLTLGDQSPTGWLAQPDGVVLVQLAQTAL
jgi:alpha-D-xyloside xylohydrolase